MCDPIDLPNILVPILWKSNKNWANSDFFSKMYRPPVYAAGGMILSCIFMISDFFFLNFTVWKLTGLFTNRGYLCIRGNKYFSNNIPKKTKGVVKMTRKLGKHDFFFLKHQKLMCNTLNSPYIKVSNSEPTLWRYGTWLVTDLFNRVTAPEKGQQ